VLRDTLAAACMDESDHLALVNAGDGEVVSEEGRGGAAWCLRTQVSSWATWRSFPYAAQNSSRKCMKCGQLLVGVLFDDFTPKRSFSCKKGIQSRKRWTCLRVGARSMRTGDAGRQPAK